MKAHTVLLSVIVLALLTGCLAPGVEVVRVVASGNPVAVNGDFTDFTRVNVGSAFRVTITQGDEYRVKVTVDENLRDYLNMGVEGDTLRIGLRPGVTYSSRPGQLRAEITMPTLEGIDLHGAVRGDVSGFESNKPLRVNLSGASNLTADLSAGDVQMEASGASHIALKGSGDSLDLEASGASNTDLSEFTVTDADVRLSGASQAQVNMKGVLDADVSGASKLLYAGEVTLGNVDSSGASTIKKE